MRALAAIATVIVLAAVAALVFLGGEERGGEPAPPPERPREPPRATWPPLPPQPRVPTVLQDDARLREPPPDQVRANMGIVAALGVDRVRLTAPWWGIAPDNESPRRPAFDAADPAAYPPQNWAKLDTSVIEATRAGVQPMLDVSFWAPRWAVARPSREPSQHRWRPSPREFGRFARALARRYSGSYVDPATGLRLPPVRLWTTWNEPNHPAFLLPQWELRRGRWIPASPHHYRAMHEAADAAIRDVDPRAQVLIGGLSSVGFDERGVEARMTPLRFVRELACVDSALRPLRRRECRRFRPLRADGFSHHPYSFRSPPDEPPELSENVTMANLGDLARLLRALHRRGRIVKPLPLHITELGWESNPPDTERGVTLEEQARYLDQAEAMAWRYDVKSFAQYLLADVPGDVNVFQTGLLFADNRPKPALQAFRTSLWVGPVRDGRARAWAHVRPGEGRRRVSFERRGPDGRWRRGERVLTDRHGVIVRRLVAASAYRLRWARPDGADELSRVATPGG